MNFFKEELGLTIVVALSIFCVVVWTATFAQTPQGELTFAVLNIGQGDGLYIQSPTGVEVLIDGGPATGALVRELPKVMSYGDRTIDAIIETHPDADHMGGFIDLLKRYQVEAFISPGIIKHNKTTDTLVQEVNDKEIPTYIARRGMWLDVGGGAQLQVLSPDYDVTHLDPSKDNEGCIVAHLVYGSTSVLLTCDAPMDIEDHLMMIGSSTDLQSTILKVGHHGSKYSSGDEFVKEVNPQVAVISVGAHNPYGHPAERVLSTLEAQHIPILRTDQDGTLTFRSDGTSFTRVQ